MNKHSPTPWRVDDYGNVEDAHNRAVATVGSSKTSPEVDENNAAHIVLCVNAWEGLSRLALQDRRHLAEFVRLLTTPGPANIILAVEMAKKLGAGES